MRHEKRVAVDATSRFELLFIVVRQFGLRNVPMHRVRTTLKQTSAQSRPA